MITIVDGVRREYKLSRILDNKEEVVINENSVHKVLESTVLAVCRVYCQPDGLLNKNSKLFVEDYESDYLPLVASRVGDMRDEWIYNILEGKSEVNAVVLSEDGFVVYYNHLWNREDVDQMQLLASPMDYSLRTLRDLRVEHVSLLRDMKSALLKVAEGYGVLEEDLLVYFHYPPSTYHLHMHLSHLSCRSAGISIPYTFNVDDVLFNLSLDSEYYVKYNMRVH